MTSAGVNAFQIIPGGQSGIIGSPFYANMLGRWLTNRYHPMLLTPAAVAADRLSEELFVP
jgi:penicillin amidase